MMPCRCLLKDGEETQQTLALQISYRVTVGGAIIVNGFNFYFKKSGAKKVDKWLKRKKLIKMFYKPFAPYSTPIQRVQDQQPRALQN